MSYNPNNFYPTQQPGVPAPQPFAGAATIQQQQQYNIAALQAQAAAQAKQARNGTPQGFPGMPGPPPPQQQQHQQQQQQQQQYVGQQMMGQQPALTMASSLGGGGQVNVAAVEQLLRSGQLTPEQFATLAQQIRSHQQQAAQRAATTGLPQPLPPQQATLPPQQQFFGQQPPPQPQPPPPQPQQLNNVPPPAPPPVNIPGAEGKIPLQMLQQHMTQIATARGINQKIQMLTQALSNGALHGPGGATSQMTAAQKPHFVNQLEEARRQLSVTVASVQAFQNQWTPAKVNADMQWYQQRGAQISIAIPTGQAQPQRPPPPQNQPSFQQQQPPPPPQPQAPPPQNPTAAQFQQAQQQAAQQAYQQFISSPQNTAARPPPLQPQQSLHAPAPPQPARPLQPTQPPASQFVPTPQPQFSTQQQTPAAPSQDSSAANGGVPGMPPLHLLQTQLNPQLFMKSLFEVMRKRGEPIEGTPYVDGKEVDLYRLYQAVMTAGGSTVVTTTGIWHRIAHQLGWPVDPAPAQLRDANPDSQRISLELARSYHKLLQPFEEVWSTSLKKQQQLIIDNQKRAQAQAQANAGVLPQQQQQPPQRPPSATQRPPSRQALPPASNQSQLDVARQQLLQQAKLTAQQLQGGGSPQLANATAASPAPFVAPGGKVNVDPTLEQLAEAKNFVATMKANWEHERPNIKLMQVPDEQKQQVALLTHELVPHVKRVVEMLPLFYAMTNDAHAVKKMLTFAGIFQDQMRYIGGGQFALDLSGLNSLREQFQRCWAFMRENAAAARRPNGAASTPIIPAAQQLKSGIKVEDLRPPPSKHRRTASGASPLNAASPQTPQTNAASPPQAGGTPQLGKSGLSKGRGVAVKKESGASPAAVQSPASMMATLRGELVVPNISTVPPSATFPGLTIPHTTSALKRKREEEELLNNPHSTIEQTLRLLHGSTSVPPLLSPSLSLYASIGLGLDLGSNLAQPPVVNDNSIEPSLSFTTLSFGATFPHQLHPAAPSYQAHHARSAVTSSTEFDFGLYLDSSAAGFDDQPDGGEDSDEAATPALTSATAATPATTVEAATPQSHSKPSTAGKDSSDGVVVAGEEDSYYGEGGEPVDDFAQWIAGGEDGFGGTSALEEERGEKAGLPARFSWEGTEGFEGEMGGGGWSVSGEF